MQVWLNGRLVNAQDAKISVFDRGFLFGDGVYEVVRFFGGAPVGMDLHIARLGRSLALTRIEGFDPTQLQSISTALIEKKWMAKRVNLFASFARRCTDANAYAAKGTRADCLCLRIGVWRDRRSRNTHNRSMRRGPRRTMASLRN